MHEDELNAVKSPMRTTMSASDFVSSVDPLSFTAVPHNQLAATSSGAYYVSGSRCPSDDVWLTSRDAADAAITSTWRRAAPAASSIAQITHPAAPHSDHILHGRADKQINW